MTIPYSAMRGRAMMPVAAFCATADGDADAVMSGAVVLLGFIVATVMVPDRTMDIEDAEVAIDDETIADIVVAVFFMTTHS
jgi:hypothetical protein